MLGKLLNASVADWWMFVVKVGTRLSVLYKLIRKFGSGFDGCWFFVQFSFETWLTVSIEFYLPDLCCHTPDSGCYIWHVMLITSIWEAEMELRLLQLLVFFCSLLLKRFQILAELAEDGFSKPDALKFQCVL